MAFGLGFLRLPPHHFWQMTPRELEAAYTGCFGEQPQACGRATLHSLMQQFPDT